MWWLQACICCVLLTINPLLSIFRNTNSRKQSQMCQYRFLKSSCNCTEGDLWRHPCANPVLVPTILSDLSLCMKRDLPLFPSCILPTDCWCCVESANQRLGLKSHTQWNHSMTHLNLTSKEAAKWVWFHRMDSALCEWYHTLWRKEMVDQDSSFGCQGDWVTDLEVELNPSQSTGQ